jgi:origin recognition complex subunit 3
VEAIAAILRFFKPSQRTNFSDLAVQALSGELRDSRTIQEILTVVKTSPSDALHGLFETLPRGLAGSDEFRELQREYQLLLKNNLGKSPLRTKYGHHHKTHKTTVVEQRVKLAKGNTKLSKQDVEYTVFIDHLHAMLEAYFSDALIKPHELFMHEAFLYDLRMPIKDVFTPRPRFTTERALSSPFDYLVSVSATAEHSLSASQPATSILYQLYLESGSVINIYDLWRAFYIIIGGEDGHNCSERLALALFYRALSELKMMGMVKQSRKKIDHIAKSAWMGL